MRNSNHQIFLKKGCNNKQYYTAYDIYIKFKEIESLYKNKSVRALNNINKLSQNKINKLQKVADYFNTIWQNIDIDDYIKIGFNKWKSFSINGIDDERILRKYISNDKKTKNNFGEISIDDINKSIAYIQNVAGNVIKYCNDSKIIRDPINDFIKNKIDPITLIFLVEKQYISLQEEEKLIISQFLNNYDDIKHNMYKYYEFILKKLKEYKMTEKKDQDNYLDDPKKNNWKDKQTENLIYGDDDSIDEKKKKKEEYQKNNLNEG